MTEELITFTPAQVSFANFDDLKKQINAYVSQRQDMAVTPETYKQIRTVKNEVGQYFTSLDNRRKTIKKQYEAPLKAFEAQFKDVTQPLVELKAGYKADMDEIDAQLAEQRRAIVMDEIAGMCEPLGINPEDVEFDSKWLNKGAYKPDMSSKTATLREISDKVQWTAKQQQLETANKKLIEAHAQAVHMDPAGWLTTVTADTDTDAVIAQMDAAKAAQAHKVKVEHVDKETGELKAVTHTVEITGDEERMMAMLKWLPSKGFEVTVIE